MSTLMLTCVSVGVALVASGLYNLQVRLERWDYNRHAED